MSINLNVSGNTQPLEAAVQAAVNRIRRNPIKITVDDKGATQPLGNMKRGADEFTKSMEAANARIIAFGASMAIINGVANAFKAVVKNVVEVEKSLADINVVMGLSAQKLDQFSDGLFKVAKETAASFDIAAAAATEYARQGLKVEETLKRTKDALILTRLTGMDSANAVKALTAAMNTYGDQIKDTTQLVSKFAAVDVQFAVSAEDFADAISRTGQAAKSAGVDIDELVGLVTAAQQQTARGGKVIGNSFKTIFTRIGRTDTLNQLENLGIAVRDLEGNTLGAKRILTDLANTFDHLTESQKSQIAQTVGGVFQINVLKAVLSDAAKQNGILANATQISASATDEAIQKNEQLRNTMAAMASETGLALKEVSAQIGEIMLAPGMEKILNIVKSMTEGLGDMLGTGENAGSGFAKGFLKGLGNIITGPGLVVMVAVFTKLLVKAVQYASQSLNSLIGVTSEAQKQKAIQTSLVTLFGQNAALNKEMLRTDISRTEKEKIILGLLKAQVVEANVLNTIARSSASNLYKQGYGPNLSPRRGRADGHIPNFAHPERQQAAQGGYAAGSIRSMNIPGEGSVIYNSAEKVKNFKGLSQPAIIPPRSSKAGQNYQQAFASMHGFDPYAAGGYIPNFSYPPPVVTKGGVEMTAFQKAAASKQSINKGKASNLKAFGADIPLNNVISSASEDFGVLLGIGRDGGPVDQRYQQPAKDLSEENMKILAKKTGIKRDDLKAWSRNKTKAGKWPSVSVELPTNAIKPISGDEADSVIEKKGLEEIKTSMSKDLNKAVNNLSKLLIKPIFKDANIKGKPFSKYSEKNKANDLIGNLAEMAVRHGLESVVESNKDSEEGEKPGAPFDFTGSHAAKIGDVLFENKIKKAIEFKLRKSTALDGGIPGKVLRGHAGGYIPNFADPLSDAIGREREAGVPVSKIRIGSHSALMNKSNPIGLGVTNTDDEPNGLKDVFGAANGYVPNYAFQPTDFRGARDQKTGRMLSTKDLSAEANRKLKIYIKKFEEGSMNQQQLNNAIKGLSQKSKDQAHVTSTVTKKTKESIGVLGRLNAMRNRATRSLGLQNANQRFEKTALGKGLSGVGGMGLMMGAPMLAGFLQEDGAAKGGASYNAGGALQGAASGAAMGMMFGPIGVAAGSLIGAFAGLAGSVKETREAIKKEAEERRKASIQSGTQLGATLAKGFSSPEEISFASSLNKSEYFGGGLRSAGRSNLKIKNPRDLMTRAGGSFAISNKGMREQLTKLVNSSETGKVIDNAINSLFSKKATTSNWSGFGEPVDSSDMRTTLRNSFKDSSLEGQEDEILKMAKSNAVKSGTGLDKASFRKAMTDQSVAKMGTEARKEMLLESLFAIKKADPKEKINYQDKDFSPDQLIEEVGDDPEKIKAAYRSMLDTYDKMKDAEEKKAEGIIIQLDLQKAQMAAQKAASMRQLEIKETYSKISDNLKFEEKLMGSLMTDQQKAQNKYLQAIKKAEEAYANAAVSADTQLRTGILAGVKDNQNIQSLLKKSLGIEEGGTIQDISEEVGSLTGKELSEKLKEIAKAEGTGDTMRKAINEMLSLEITKRQDILDLAEENKDISTSQAEREQKVNNILAGRSQIIKDLERKNRMSSEGIRSSQKIRGFAEQVAAARRLSAVGPGYQTAREREDFAMSEKGFGLESKITTLEENRGKSIRSQEKEARLLKNDQAELYELYDKEGKNNNDLARIKLLEKSELERLKKLEEIEQKIKNINSETDEEINKAKILLELEKERLEEKRKYETGPGAFGRGAGDAQKKIVEQAETMEYRLGNELTNQFRNGLVDGMQAAINKADDLSDVMNNIAMNFLGAIQKAYLGKAADAIVGALPFSSGGGVRKYSRGGGVPAMVTNGEYVMGRDAVNRYGGGFMHSLNAGGKLPGYSTGGGPKPGSALAANFGGGEGYNTGRRYQGQPMSGFFYSGQAGNIGLQEDTQYTKGIIQERMRKAAEKKAKKRALMQQLIGTVLSVGLGSMVSSGLGGLAESGALGEGAMLDSWGKSSGIDSAAVNQTMLETGMSRTEAMGINQPFKNNYDYGALIEDSGFKAAYRGGKINGYASGGHISGKSGIDQIPAMLSEGEYVIRASSARQLGKPMLDRINAGKFNDGGAVTPLIENSETGTSGGNTNNINITVNMEKGKGKSEENDSSGSGGANPKDSSNDDDRGARMAEKIKDQIVSVIMEEQRPGGLLSD